MKCMKPNESREICGACGGECCLTKPGIESPARFVDAPGGPASSILQALLSGKWVLDIHYGLPPGPDGERQVPAREIQVLYPRPATSREQTEKGVFGSSDAGPCCFLSANRCMLEFEERPMMCRALEPASDFNCHSGWTRLDAARAWWPWQQEIHLALSRLQKTTDPPPNRDSMPSGDSSGYST